MNAVLQAALDLAARDFHVFPAVAGGKEPACANGVRDATTDPEQIRRWFEADPSLNLAVAPERSGCFVLDLDPPLGAETIASLELEHGTLPATLTLQTPRGGFHHWFKGRCNTTVQKIGPKVDTRGYGGYVLMPPSVVNGKPYMLLHDRPIADGPEWIARLAHASREGHSARVSELDLPVNVDRFQHVLAHREGAIQGAGGDQWTYDTACIGLDLGLSEAAVFKLMRPWNVEKCEPAWDEDELRTKITNAAEYMQNEAGAHATRPAEEVFGDWAAAGVQDTVADTAELGAGRSFEEVMSRDVPQVVEIVPDYLEKGVPTFLAGRGESSKSTLGIHWGTCIGAGHPILGRQPFPVEEVVHLSSEDDRDEVDRRVQRVANRLGIKGTIPLKCFDRVGKPSVLARMYEGGDYELTQFYHGLHAYLRGIPGHKVVIFDSCLDYVAFVGKAKIDEGAVNTFIKIVLQNLCTETDSTLLVLWHPSQSGIERGDGSGWSVAWVNAPRARLTMAAVKDVEGAYELKVEKRSHGRKPPPVTLHWSEGALLPLTDAAANEQEGALRKAAVRVAIMAADAGCPIQMQKRLVRWQVDEVEHDIGRRPTEREVKEALGAALPKGELRYLKGTNRRVAGFYPPDQARAEELARAAKGAPSRGGGRD